MKLSLFRVIILNSFIFLLVLPVVEVKTPLEMFTETNFNNKIVSQNSDRLINTKTVDTQKPKFISYYEKIPEWPSNNCFGRMQSPINLPGDIKSYSTEEVFQVVETNYKLVRGYAMLTKYSDTIHSITFEDHNKKLVDQGYIIAKKNGYLYKYIPTEIQFHLPSEHTINGLYGDLEMHIIHVKDSTYLKKMLTEKSLEKDPDEKFSQLYISVLFKSVDSKENENIKKLKSHNLGPVLNFDLAYYVPFSLPFGFYEGSMTMPVPGCFENVNWVVNLTMDTMSKAQLGFFMSWMYGTFSARGNSRSIQKLNERKIYLQLYNNPNPSSLNSTASGGNIVGIFSVLFCLFLI